MFEISYWVWRKKEKKEKEEYNSYVTFSVSQKDEVVSHVQKIIITLRVQVHWAKINKIER